MSLTDWNVTQPLDHSLIASIPGYLRDIQSSAKIILSKEHVQPSTSQAGGQHLKGSTRVYLESSTPTTDPEGNSLDTSATSDNGRVAVLTGSSNIIKVFANTSAGVSTSWQHAAVGRVYLADTMNANSKHIVGLPTATQSGSPLHVGQLDTTYFAGISTGTIQPKFFAGTTTYIAASGQDGVVCNYAKDSAKLNGLSPDASLGAMTTVDSQGNALAYTNIYLASCDGIVTWNDLVGNGDNVWAVVGSNPPATVVARFHNSSVSNQYDSRSFHVAKGEYFRIVADGPVDKIYWRPLVQTGGAPVKQ